MDSHLESLRQSLPNIQAKYRNCTDCALHRNRSVPVRSCGFVDKVEQLVFITDKPSIASARTGKINVGYEWGTLKLLCDTLGHPVDPAEYLLIPAIACPPKGASWRGTSYPAPKEADVKACLPRILEELREVDPLILVTFGAQAMKPFLPKGTAFDSSVGKMLEGFVEGVYARYAVPVMPLPSLSSLYRDELGSTDWMNALDGMEWAFKIYRALRKHNENK